MTSRPLRKDSARKREQIIDAARELFSERGLGVGLNEIACQAGVGVGTVYRHFPDKEQLLDVLYEQRLEEVVVLAERALADEDSWRGLSKFLDGWVRLHLKDRSLTRVFMDPGLGQQRVDASRDRIAPLTDAIADRARMDGYTREDFQGTDVFFIQLSLVGLIDRSHAHAPHIYRRYLAMMLEGIRSHPRPEVPLPVPALDVNATHRMVTQAPVEGADTQTTTDRGIAAAAAATGSTEPRTE
ncbi:TetR/AcrR family transcriptional regulator [Rhodococcus sp. ACT016]|uniref:TetR/AcrR family transcriptional regulator n=1 Tax=Rhodococcus sp. ACT016 TaxID=3134808 RepID=UPI003D2AD458